MEAGQAPYLIMEPIDSQEKQKTREIPLIDVESVYIKNLQLIRQNTIQDKKQRKRSSSALKRVFNKLSDKVGAQDDDPFDYAFEIQMPDRFYLLYTELEIEAQRWVRVLDLLVKMNKCGIPHHRANPFDYEKHINEAQKANSQELEDKKAVMPVVKIGQLPAQRKPAHKL